MLTEDMLPWWESEEFIIGFEEDEDENADENSDEEDPDADADEETEEEEDEDNDPAAGLKSALVKERKDRKAAEKRAKDAERKVTRLEKGQGQKQTQAEIDAETAKEDAAGSQAKVAKLAERVLNQELGSAIKNAASKLNFADPEDAIALIRRSDLEYDQDDDDPADVEIDEKSVEKAVKALAKKKPHLIKASGDGEETGPSGTGSTFGGKAKNKQKSSEEELRRKYPALGQS